MAVTYNKELDAQLLQSLKQGNLHLVMEYDYTNHRDKYDEFTNTLVSPAGKAKGITLITTTLLQFLPPDLDPQLAGLLREEVHQLLTEYDDPQHLISVLHNRHYMEVAFITRSYDLLVRMGLWQQVAEEDAQTLSPLLCHLRLRAEKPDLYQQYLSAYTTIITHIESLRQHMSQHGAPAALQQFKIG